MELIDLGISDKSELVYCDYENLMYMKDILEIIFKFLTVRDLVNVRKTSKFWNQTSRCCESKFQQQKLYRRLGAQVNDSDQIKDWPLFHSLMDNKFGNLSVLNCYPYNLDTSLFSEYYWNLGPSAFACFIANLFVHRGKYYYEVIIVNDLLAHIGWSSLDYIPQTNEGEGLGAMKNSFSWNGRECKSYCNQKIFNYGVQWKNGDIVGCGIDFDNNCVSFWLNGEPMSINPEDETANKEPVQEDEIKEKNEIKNLRDSFFKEKKEEAKVFTLPFNLDANQRKESIYFCPSVSAICSVGAPQTTRGNIAFLLKKQKYLPDGYTNISKGLNIPLLKILNIEKHKEDETPIFNTNVTKSKDLKAASPAKTQVRPWSTKTVIWMLITDYKVFFGNFFTIGPLAGYLIFGLVLANQITGFFDITLWSIILGTVFLSLILTTGFYFVYLWYITRKMKQLQPGFAESIDDYENISETSSEEKAVVELESNNAIYVNSEDSQKSILESEKANLIEVTLNESTSSSSDSEI